MSIWIILFCFWSEKVCIQIYYIGQSQRDISPVGQQVKQDQKYFTEECGNMRKWKRGTAGEKKPSISYDRRGKMNQSVNADFLKPQVSCEILILISTIYLLLSPRKKKYRKHLPCKKGRKQTSIHKEDFLLNKAFSADSEVYGKYIYIYKPEKNDKNRPKLVNVVLSFTIKSVHTRTIPIANFYQ